MAAPPESIDLLPSPGAVFVADVHLGCSPDVDARFGRFLERLPAGVSFVSLGDLVNAWAEGSSYDFGDLCPALRRLRGRPSFFLRGNRDFLMGPRWEALTGGRIVGDQASFRVGERSLSALHGDTLMTADLRYRFWRIVARSGAVAFAAAVAGRAAALRLTGALRRGSEAEIRRKDPALFRLDDEASVRAASGADLLLCGHAHEPSRSILSGGVERIVLGSWDRGGECLFAGSDGLRFGRPEELSLD